MPKQQILPIWGGLNTANSPSATGLVDTVTNQTYNTGGLSVGDYFDLTEQQANSLSNTATGLCHEGRYRYVLLDSGATVANVKTGTVGYLRAGTFVQNVVITDAGTGATPGTYTIAANSGGGGFGATIQVVVGSGGTITSVAVVNGGYGYVAIPTFTLTATGTTGGAVAAQLNTTPNVVTSADVATANETLVRPVVFLNTPTPGNYTFIQELGTATLLAGGAITANNFVSAGSTGTVTGGTTFLVNTVGQAIDAGSTGNLFKAYLNGPVVQD